MSVTVRMPQLGETVMEGTILRWAKEPGDAISEEEVLLEVSTDKVDTEVPSPAAGVVLEILVPAGETVPVGTALAVIGEAGELPAAAAQQAAVAVPSPPAALPVAPPQEAFRPASAEFAPPPIRRDGERTPADLGFLSPVVRRLASDHDLDLREVAGTGREGRVTRKDVEAFIDARAQAAPETPVSEVPVPAVVMPEAAPAAPPRPVVEILPAVPVGIAPAEPVPTPPAPPVAAPVPEAAAEPAPVAAPPKRVGLGRGIGALIPTGAIPTAARPVTAPEAAPEAAPAAAAPAAAAPAEPAPKPPTMVPLRPSDRAEDPSRLRMRIAEHMVTNRRTAAHVWTAVEVDFEAVEQVRRRRQEAFKSHEGFSLTYLPFIARATVDALNAFPVVNSSFYAEEKKQVFHGAINLGIAVDLDQRGLIVMDIPGADGIRMRELARRIRAVADKARRGDLTPDDAAGSTFTITNPGPYGSFMSAPIINVPEVAILSTDTVTKRPVVVTDSIGNDAIAVRHIGYLGLSWDHRAFDGSTAVLFLRRIKEILETRDWEQELA